MSKSGLVLLVILVLLGNGLRSVISSAVFVSEGEFASFLKISVTKTSAVIELLLGAVLLSLLVSPHLMRRYAPKFLAIVMCVIAGASSLGLAALFWVSPSVDTREAAVIFLFPLLGFALASLAPISQLMTGWGGEKHTKFLTGAWAVAMPAAFLITPQLVRVIAPRYGLDLFFALFAIIPLLLILGVWRAAPIPAPKPRTAKSESGSWTSLIPMILALLIFEALTLTMTIAGVTSPWIYPLVGLMVAALVFLIFSKNRSASNASRLSGEGYVIGVFAFLFFINIATTGFYDTAYLLLHSCSNTLIADRATIGALAQVAAAIGTTALLARYPIQNHLMLGGALITTAGLASYMLYFTQPFFDIFVVTKAVVSFGIGMLTTAAIFAVSTKSSGSVNLSLYTAFIIIIGTEFGLEAFEMFIQIMNLWSVDIETSYFAIFQTQVVLLALSVLILVLTCVKTQHQTSVR